MYKDNFSTTFSTAKDFNDFLVEKENVTGRIAITVGNTKIWAGKTEVKNGETVIKFTRLDSDCSFEKAYVFSPSTEQLDTVSTYGTHLFISVPTQYKKKLRFIPLSTAVHLSLANRSRASLHLNLNENFTALDDGTESASVNPVALAKTFEDMMKLNSHKIQLIVVANKVIGIMSGRYASIPQSEIFTNIAEKALRADFQNADLVFATYTHSECTARYDIKTDYSADGRTVSILVDVHDSPNGYKEVAIVPVYTTNNRHFFRFEDDGWSSPHIKISTTTISDGIHDILPKLKDNAEGIIKMQNYTLKQPAYFVLKAIEELNKKAKHQGGTKIPDKIKDSIYNSVESQIAMGICTKFSPMDIMEYILEEIENNASAEDTSKNGQKKTLSRFVRLDLDKLDTI